MDALVGLGLNLHIDYEPFEFLAGIAFAFRNSDADATAARKRHSAQLTKEQKRDAVYKVDVRSRRKAARKQGQGPGQRAGSDEGARRQAAREDERKPRTGDTSVMASIPPEVVYFFRTIVAGRHSNLAPHANLQRRSADPCSPRVCPNP